MKRDLRGINFCQSDKSDFTFQVMLLRDPIVVFSAFAEVADPTSVVTAMRPEQRRGSCSDQKKTYSTCCFAVQSGIQLRTIEIGA